MRVTRWRVMAALALLGVAPISCVWPYAPSNPNSISGRVRVEILLTDVSGAPLGVRKLDDADGVRVYLVGPGRTDSTRTTAGAYEFFHVPAGDWGVSVGVGGVRTDVTYLGIRPKDHLVIRDTLVLGRNGDLSATPNPFSFQTAIRFALPADAPARLQVVDLAGTLRRVLADRTFVAGAHILVWDGANDAGKPLPAGTYAIVFRSGDERRCEIAAKGP